MWVAKVSTPTDCASVAIRCCVGPIHWPPTSTTLPSPSGSFSVRPPTRSRASSTTTDAPAARSVARRHEPGKAGADHHDIRFARH